MRLWPRGPRRRVQVERAAARVDDHDRFVPRVKHRAHNERQLPHTRPTYRDRALRINEAGRSEEHTSELQSLAYLVCRLLLEKKKKKKKQDSINKAALYTVKHIN